MFLRAVDDRELVDLERIADDEALTDGDVADGRLPVEGADEEPDADEAEDGEADERTDRGHGEGSPRGGLRRRFPRLPLR